MKQVPLGRLVRHLKDLERLAYLEKTLASAKYYIAYNTGSTVLKKVIKTYPNKIKYLKNKKVNI
jgi:hypothetical protein